MIKKYYHKKKQSHERDTKLNRHTHSTIAGLEDLNAVINSIAFSTKRITLYMQELTKELEKLTNYYPKALGILHEIRKSPYTYKTEFLIKTQITKKEGGNGSN